MSFNAIRNLSDVIQFEQRHPLEEIVFAQNAYELLCHSAAQFGDDEALVFIADGNNPFHVNARYTYRELLTRVHKTANLLTMIGCKATDTISLLLPNLPEMHFMLWGGAACCQVSPINPMLEPDVIASIMSASGSKTLVTIGDVPGTGIWQKVEVIRELIPDLENVIVIGAMGTERDVINYAAIIDRFNGDALDVNQDICSNDVATLFHTGGTTGLPKLVPQTHGNLVFLAHVLGEMMSFKPKDTVLVGVPLFHCNAAIGAGLYPLAHGGRILLTGISGFSSPGILENFYRMVDHYKVNRFSAVPFVYEALVKQGKPKEDLSSLRFAVCSAGPLPISIFNQFQSLTGVDIIEGYGLTEAAVGASINPISGAAKPGSVGLRFPYTDICCAEVDEDGSVWRYCDVGETGRVLIKGNHIMSGYWHSSYEDVVSDASFVVDVYGERWFDSGDLGYQDIDGYLWLTGKTKDLINRGGHKIDPCMIENAVLGHPAVLASAAVARPDAVSGEVPVLFVVLKPGMTNLDEDELMEFVVQRIPEPASYPCAVRVVERLPRNAIGKVFKPQLAWWQIEEAFGELIYEELGLDATVSVQAVVDKGVVVSIGLNDGVKNNREDPLEAVEALLKPYHYKISMVS